MKQNLLIPIHTILLAASLALGAGPASAAEASPSELLEKGIYAEETKGDVDAAITIYQQLIAEAKTTQSLAAQAQFRLAQCYLKKNKTAEANEAFAKLIHDFPNEKELVAKAREHLPGDLVLEPVPWVDGERLLLDLKLEGGMEIGALETRADSVELAGRKIWRVGRLMTGGGQLASSVDVDPDTFRPLASHGRHSLLGEYSAVFHPGEVEYWRTGTAEPQKLDFDEVVYDNEECFHLLRRMPLKVGYQPVLPIIATLGGATKVSLELEVKPVETIAVPAGKFDCFPVLIKSLNQTLWFSADAHRYLVKFEGGGAIGELATIAHHKPEEEVPYRNEATGVSLTAPGGWMVHFRTKEKPADPDRVALLDPQADADAAVLEVTATDSLKEAWRQSARAWAEADFQENQARKLKDAKVRPESWKEETISGRPGVTFLVDYTESGKPRVAYHGYALGPKTSAQFTLASAADKFDALETAFDRIVASYQHPQ